MATRIFSASMFTTKQCFSSIFLRSYASLSNKYRSSLLSLSSVSRLRPIATRPLNFTRFPPAATNVRCLTTLRPASFFKDLKFNSSVRGLDFKHWVIVMVRPKVEPTRDEIIDGFIKTLATVVGSEEEARMKIYSITINIFHTFGALISEELADKMKKLKQVRCVVPDFYLEGIHEGYLGEPFINGQAVTYDPEFHERNMRNDTRCNSNRSRNFDKRRKNMQPNRQGGIGGRQNMGGLPGGMGLPQNTGGGSPGGMGDPQSMGVGPHNMGGGYPGAGSPQYMGVGQPDIGRMPQKNMGGIPHNKLVGPNYIRGVPSNMGAGNFQPRNMPKHEGYPPQSGPDPNSQYQNYPPPKVRAGGNP